MNRHELILAIMDYEAVEYDEAELILEEYEESVLNGLEANSLKEYLELNGFDKNRSVIGEPSSCDWYYGRWLVEITDDLYETFLCVSNKGYSIYKQYKCGGEVYRKEYEFNDISEHEKIEILKKVVDEVRYET